MFLLIGTSASCALGYRGRRSTAANVTEHAINLEVLYAQKPLVGATYSDLQWTLPVGYQVLDTSDPDATGAEAQRGLRLWPYAGPTRDRIHGAYGIEAGVHARVVRYLYVEAGVSQTFGDARDTLPFWGAGYDIGAMLSSTCGCF